MLEIVTLGSGSRGNCTLVRRDGHAVLIDAGLSAREIARRCAAVGQDLGRNEAILLTHEHADHVLGLRVFARALANLREHYGEERYRTSLGRLWLRAGERFGRI